MYAAHLIKEKRSVDTMDLYVKHGAPAAAQNFNIYKRIVHELLNKRDMNKAEAFRNWADLRDMLFDLVSTLYLVCCFGGQP